MIIFNFNIINNINIKYKKLKIKKKYWGLGIGDWAQSPIPNPQSPIPNPQIKKIIKIIIYYYYFLFNIIIIYLYKI